MSDDLRRKGLGRGLSALLEEDPEDQATLDRLRTAKPVGIEQIEPSPFQPRRYFDEDELQSLVDSIVEHGILQPILVRHHPDDPGRYQIVAGERRRRAAQLASLHEVPIVVKELSDSQTLELAIIENVQRQDLTAIEEAEGYRRLLDEFGHTQEALGRLLGKSRSMTVALSGAQCGCNVAAYVVPMASNTLPGQCDGDRYCDVNSVCGVMCSEIDLMEANRHAFRGTAHAPGDSRGGGAIGRFDGRRASAAV